MKYGRIIARNSFVICLELRKGEKIFRGRAGLAAVQQTGRWYDVPENVSRTTWKGLRSASRLMNNMPTQRTSVKDIELSRRSKSCNCVEIFRKRHKYSLSAAWKLLHDSTRYSWYAILPYKYFCTIFEYSYQDLNINTRFTSYIRTVAVAKFGAVVYTNFCNIYLNKAEKTVLLPQIKFRKSFTRSPCICNSWLKT